MKRDFLCHLILLTGVLLGFGLKIEAQVKETDKDLESVATLQGTVMDASGQSTHFRLLKGKPIKGAIVTTKPPTSEAVTQADGSYRILSVVGGAYKIIAKTSDKRVGTTNIYVVTADRNVVPGIQIRVRDSETLQSKLQKRWKRFPKTQPYADFTEER
ncbi:MAG: carboxypeptidase-like regulatory domain-containing protein [Candidatus Poribacteria bacterium]